MRGCRSRLSDRTLAVFGNPATPSLASQSITQPEGIQLLSNPNSIPEPTALESWAAIELAQFKASFLARTSHELRSPLNGLISSLQMIQADLCDSPEEEREYVAMAHSAALKLVELLDEVIDVSKVQWGSRSLKPEAIDLDLLLQEIAYCTHLQAQNRNLRVYFPELEDTILIYGDRACLQQALTILVDIPLTIMQEGQIYVDLQVIGQQACIRLQDDRSPADWDGAIAVLNSPKPEFPELQSLPSDPRLLPQFSPALRLLIAKELLAANQASVEIVQETDRPTLLCRLPLASP
ncbi:HAMP domain-containing sensor histidine kinase [Alkalinema sp. FACHB-956]|uniref:sensor histidine kinase n=1 Tax=Alkalinema sp. FACHB-956 TaxID=2692768 RepID=UPI0016862B6D|nr:HAMP domain-containing sensor histidine kinase [Alkalinema sp. FACHB-956]MBD2326991.1 HAMP domain-containing histidine kinase [Alkalinema sp. FACHB-956]